MVRITHSKGGATFAVKVVPRASRTEITGTHQDLIRVRLAAPPVEGAANRALVKFLAGVLDVSRRDVEIVAGHTSRRKVIRVTGLSPQEVKTRLLAGLPPP
jgi:uncharacterized protein (TIGR00251 family)